MYRWLTLFIAILVAPVHVLAATLQYDTATNVVTGFVATGSIQDVPGRTLVTVASNFLDTFPRPPGCTGDPQPFIHLWRVTSTSPLTIGLIPGVSCFRNRYVTSKTEVDQIVEEEITRAIPVGSIDTLSRVTSVVVGRCPATDVTPACTRLRAALTNASPATAIIDALITDADTVKAGLP